MELRGTAAVIILGIDPGSSLHGWCLYDPVTNRIEFGHEEHDKVIDIIRRMGATHFDLHCAIELPVPRQQPFGYYLADTVFLAAQLAQAWKDQMLECNMALITSNMRSMHFCGVPNCKDPQTNGALYDRLADGTQKGSKGTKAEPGPMYGMNNQHVKDALAIAIFYADHYKYREMSDGAQRPAKPGDFKKPQ